MALAQPTGLQVQELEPLISVEQNVERWVVGDCRLLTEAGDDLLTESGDTLAAEPCLLPLVQVTQLVDDSAVIMPGGTLATVSQEVVRLSDVPGGPIITLSQTIERQTGTQRLIRLRQITLVAP